jgi:ABC-type transporter Mla MlaB component
MDEGLSTPLNLRAHSLKLYFRFIPCSVGEGRVVRAMALDQGEFKTITVEGPATIYEAAALRETLREALAQGTDLRIDLGESGRWDLAGLQLLISAVNTGQSQGRTVRFLRVPKVCAEIADRSGLADWLHAVSE